METHELVICFVTHSFRWRSTEDGCKKMEVEVHDKLDEVGKTNQHKWVKLGNKTFSTGFVIGYYVAPIQKTDEERRFELLKEGVRAQLDATAILKKAENKGDEWRGD